MSIYLACHMRTMTTDIDLSDPRLRAAIDAAAVFIAPQWRAARETDDALTRTISARYAADDRAWSDLQPQVVQVLAEILQRADASGSYPESFLLEGGDESLRRFAEAIYDAGCVIAPVPADPTTDPADKARQLDILARLLITASAIDAHVIANHEWAFPKLWRALSMTSCGPGVRPGSPGFALALATVYESLNSGCQA